MITLVLLFSVSVYSVEELDFSSYLASNDSGVDRSVQSVQTISQGQYIGGGVVGTLIGAGIGHAVQERWLKTGWIHTTLQVGAGTTFIVAGFASVGSAIGSSIGRSLARGLFGEDERTPTTRNTVAETIGIIALIVLVGAKIYEIIDVWVLPSSMKAVSNKGLHMTPTLYSHHNQGNFMGLQLQYKF